MYNLIAILNEIHHLMEQQVQNQKKILNLEEASKFLGISKSDLYKRTSTNSIPFHKPSGKLIYFLREDLEAWMLSNRHSTTKEIKELSSNLKLGGIKNGK
jgi:excisionase family DNA binding protein